VVEHFAPSGGITLKTILREFPTRRRRSPQVIKLQEIDVEVIDFP